MADTEQSIHDGTVQLSAVIAALARRATARMGELIGSDNEHVALKASADILDRTPETSKTFKHSVTSFSITSEDAKELAASLVAGARVRAAAPPPGDFIPAAGELALEAGQNSPSGDGHAQPANSASAETAPNSNGGSGDA